MSNLKILYISKVFSHISVVLLNNFYIQKLKKLSNFLVILFYSTNKKTFYQFQTQFFKFFIWNIFSQRGFRLARALTYHKIGKISAFKGFKSKIF